jgi:protease II
VDIGLTKDGRYLVVNSNTKEDSEVWVMDRDDPNQSIP